MNKLLKAAMAALLAVHVAKTVVRNRDWHDELSIFKVRDMIRIYHRCKFYNNFFHIVTCNISCL